MKTNDSKHAIDHDNNPINEDSNMNLSKNHKDWFNIGKMGKQLGKPKTAKPEIKKEKKNWK